MSRNLGALISWNPVGLFRPVMGQLYLYLYKFVANSYIYDRIYITYFFKIKQNSYRLRVDPSPPLNILGAHLLTGPTVCHKFHSENASLSRAV
jgi:hypothetical protein